MGAQHTYLQNLAATTTMHWTKFGKCFETQVADLHVESALNKAGVAGSCTMDGFTKEDGQKTVTLPEFGAVTFSVWEQASGLQNLAATTTMHWVRQGKCFQTQVADLHTETALNNAGVAGSCTMDGFTKEDGEKTVAVPNIGNVTFSVWEQAGLQNLAATTTMHWVRHGTCFQTQVADLHTETALNNAGVAGSCTMDGFTKEDGEKTVAVPNIGNVTFSVWEQASGMMMMI